MIIMAHNCWMSNPRIDPNLYWMADMDLPQPFALCSDLRQAIFAQIMDFWKEANL